MTQQDYDELLSLPGKADELNEQLASIKARIAELWAKCDHTYPDGKDARVAPLVGAHDWQCKICGYVG